jgi:glucose-6-phosphate 1-dehydrogenase
MEGDRALFTSRGSVEAAWKVINDVLTDHDTALPYAPGTWGPEAADALASDWGGWREPVTDTAAAGSPSATTTTQEKS